jgi:hypothetical protein
MTPVDLEAPELLVTLAALMNGKDFLKTIGEWGAGEYPALYIKSAIRKLEDVLAELAEEA